MKKFYFILIAALAAIVAFSLKESRRISNTETKLREELTLLRKAASSSATASTGTAASSFDQVGFLADLFACFKAHGLSVDMISTSETNVTVSLDPSDNLVNANVLDALCADLSKVCRVKVITHPLDLMGIHQQIEAFFIDARIPWLHNAPLGLQDSLMQNAHLVVYNSDKLPPHSPLRLAKHLKLFQGNINTDWVDGYLLGREHMSDTPSPSPIRQ